MSKIKINPKTKEVEIEVPDSFIREYLQGLGVSLKKPSNVVISKPSKKTKSLSKKKSVPGVNYNTIIEVLKLSGKDVGLTIKEICDTTNLSKLQVGYEIRKGMKNGIIKQTDKGVYEYVKEVKQMKE